LDIDPNTIQIKRVLDCNDRFLRDIRVGLGSGEKGFERNTGFDIAVASEVMAIMALAKDAADLKVNFLKLIFWCFFFLKKNFQGSIESNCGGSVSARRARDGGGRRSGRSDGGVDERCHHAEFAAELGGVFRFVYCVLCVVCVL
jgi:hypothetical protein